MLETDARLDVAFQPVCVSVKTAAGRCCCRQIPKQVAFGDGVQAELQVTTYCRAVGILKQHRILVLGMCHGGGDKSATTHYCCGKVPTRV